MRKVKWGVLGTADIARRCTIPGMQQAENCALYAIAGRTQEKAEQFRAAFGFEKAYGSYEELLADPQVEAVYLPLPNELHCQWAIRALQAKKHVLCEKPLAPTQEEITKMFAAAEENGVLLMEAFAYLHSPFVRAIREELDSGTIGRPVYMESAFLTSDYDIRNIRMRRETFGGCTYDLGCYCSSQILFMLDGEPERVKAIADFSDRGIDILTSAQLTYADGRRAAFQSGMCLATEQGHRIDRFRIFGEAGSIRSDAKFNQSGTLTYVISKDGRETVKTVEVPDNYRLEVEQLGRCITDGEEPLVSRAFTLRNAAVLGAVLREIGY